MAEIRVERKERRNLLPWILGLALLALVLWGLSQMNDRDDDTAVDTGASAAGVSIEIEQQPPALRQYAEVLTESLLEAA